MDFLSLFLAIIFVGSLLAGTRAYRILRKAFSTPSGMSLGEATEAIWILLRDLKANYEEHLKDLHPNGE